MWTERKHREQEAKRRRRRLLGVGGVGGASFVFYCQDYLQGDDFSSSIFPSNLAGRLFLVESTIICVSYFCCKHFFFVEGGDRGLCGGKIFKSISLFWPPCAPQNRAFFLQLCYRILILEARVMVYYTLFACIPLTADGPQRARLPIPPILQRCHPVNACGHEGSYPSFPGSRLRTF